jgi:hypothetical protein
MKKNHDLHGNAPDNSEIAVVLVELIFQGANCIAQFFASRNRKPDSVPYSTGSP